MTTITQANRPPVVVRVYQGKKQFDAEQAFAADASVLAADGYRPTNQRWADGKPGVGRVLAIGIFALVAKPAGTLTVTYELVSPEQS